MSSRFLARLLFASRFECWNTRCANYAGAGVRLGARETFNDERGNVCCYRCGRTTTPGRRDDRLWRIVRVLSAMFGGALIGWAVKGPPAAIVGAGFGFLLGVASRGPGDL
jgi:hypothetical protein